MELYTTVIILDILEVFVLQSPAAHYMILDVIRSSSEGTPGGSPTDQERIERCFVFVTRDVKLLRPHRKKNVQQGALYNVMPKA